MLQTWTAASVQASWKVKVISCFTVQFIQLSEKIYIAEFTEMLPTLNQLLETLSTLVSRKVAMYTFYAWIKFREERLAWTYDSLRTQPSAMMLHDCKQKR